MKVLELFAGIGAPRKALENIGADFEIVDAVEIEPTAVKAYNMLYDEDHKPQNILDWDKNVEVDIIIHGSPCQDFSTAGKNDLSTGRSLLYRKSLEIIEKTQPKYVIWENVKGLVNKRNIEHFNYYIDAMTRGGYTSVFKVLNAKDFGIPQNRNRIFTISIRNDLLQTFDFDNLTTTTTEPLIDFLDNDVDISYYVRQNSMINAVKAKKIRVINNVCETITTGTFKWNCSGFCMVELRNYSAHNRVVNIESGIAPTLTTNHGETPFKIAMPILDEPLKDIPIFKSKQ